MQSKRNPLDSLGCDMIEACYPLESTGDCVYVDEEGTFKIDADSRFVLFEGFHAPLAGRALVVGTNLRTGDTIAPKADALQVAKVVKFLSLREARAFRPDPNKWQLS